VRMLLLESHVFLCSFAAIKSFLRLNRPRTKTFTVRVFDVFAALNAIRR
jgi:hypothetical protein